MDARRITVRARKDGKSFEVDADDLELVLPSGVTVELNCSLTHDGWMSMLAESPDGSPRVLSVRPAAINWLYFTAEHGQVQPHVAVRREGDHMTVVHLNSAQGSMKVVVVRVDGAEDAETAATTVCALDPRRFAAVMALESRDIAERLTEQFQPQVAEVIFTDGVDGQQPQSEELATRAFEKLGFGQDFVFQSSTVEGAADFALRTLSAEGRDGWEGEYLVIAVPSSAEASLVDYLSRGTSAEG